MQIVPTQVTRLEAGKNVLHAGRKVNVQAVSAVPGKRATRVVLRGVRTVIFANDTRLPVVQ